MIVDVVTGGGAPLRSETDRALAALDSEDTVSVYVVLWIILCYSQYI